jgi:hypothetical protein
MSALRRITTLAATDLIAAASFAGGTAALASSPAVPRPHLARITTYGFVARDEGEGATLAAAQYAATNNLISDYYGCKRPFTYTRDGQFTDGTWWADIQADCEGFI